MKQLTVVIFSIYLYNFLTISPSIALLAHIHKSLHQSLINGPHTGNGLPDIENCLFCKTAGYMRALHMLIYTYMYIHKI